MTSLFENGKHYATPRLGKILHSSVKAVKAYHITWDIWSSYYICYILLTVTEGNLAYYLQFQAINCKTLIEITKFSITHKRWTLAEQEHSTKKLKT